MEYLLETSGFLIDNTNINFIIGKVVLLLVLGFTGAHLIFWTAFVGSILWGIEAPNIAWYIFGGIAAIFNIPFLRQNIVSKPVMGVLKAIGFLPEISETERIALKAGNKWIDAEYFSGKPNWKRILNEHYPEITEKEKAFLDGPTNELCDMVTDWEIYQLQDLPARVWDFIKKENFFGLGIPEAYGGMGFSANAMNLILGKIGSRSVPLCVDIMVPNSLGPGELINHYGTQKQKDFYLPRLAKGEDIPCFALTEPNAGSDASSISSSGTVFKGDDGKLYLKLNWDKRYITLAGVSTLLGLAFQLSDPDNLLGKGTEPGITCALIPTDLEGVTLGQRHNPLGTPFINSPTQGKDVVVSVDQIIGGPDQAGGGWRMLMETLAGGRGIFLPAMGNGASKMIVRMVGAYAMVRKQFGLEIGKFEGIEEILTRIGGITYFLEGLSRFTCGALDKGSKPPVISAIAKYQATEMNRTMVNDAMDIVGGAGIVLGPKNLIGHGYMALPIGITVEGSNIVTRSLIIFGQGLIRCHPFALDEMESLENGDVKGFDKAFWGHIGLTISNTFRSLLLSLSRGWLSIPPTFGPTAKYYRRLSWASASFAFMADLSLATLGGELKKKEKLSGYFADILSWQYMATCALRKFEADGRPKDDLPLVKWCCEYALVQIQRGFDNVYANLPVPVLGKLFSGPVAIWSRFNAIGTMPNDKLGAQVAKIMITPGDARDRLTDGLFMPSDETEQASLYEKAFNLTYKNIGTYKKIGKAIRSGKIRKARPKYVLDDALEANVITQEEYNNVVEMESIRDKVVAVDSFNFDELPVQLPDPSKKVKEVLA